MQPLAPMANESCRICQSGVGSLLNTSELSCTAGAHGRSPIPEASDAHRVQILGEHGQCTERRDRPLERQMLRKKTSS